MRRTAILAGVRMMRFRSVLDRCEASELSKLDAAELLGVDERTFRRWCQRYREEGEAGLVDRRLGKPSSRQVPVDEALRVAELYRTRYSGFTAQHFHEHLVRDHGFRWGYTWTKTFLHGQGLLRAAPRRGAHRRKRPRRPMPGMMLHQDGSRHVWLAGLPACDLIATLDDATSALYSAFLVDEEGTASTFRGLLEVFGEHGLPLSLYTDRGSHYFVTPKAGGPGARPARRRAYRRLLPPGARSLRACLQDAAGSPEQGADAGRDHHRRGGQPVYPGGLSAPAQRTLRRARRADRHRLPAGAGHRAGRSPLRAGGAPSGQRQHGRLPSLAPADPAQPLARPLRQGNRRGAPLRRRDLCHLPRPPMHRSLRQHRRNHR